MRDKYRFLSEPLAAPAVPLSLFGRCLDLIMDLSRKIPRTEAPPEALEALGGYLFPEGTAIVDSLAEAMHQRPLGFERYTDAQGVLTGRLRAQGWWTLHTHLQDLADRARLLYQLEQSAAARTALGILRDVQHRAGGPYAGPTDRLCARSAQVALVLLRAWHQRRGGRR